MKKTIFTFALLCAAVFVGVCCSDDDQDSGKVYRIGDFYNSGNVKGVVFALEDAGRHGMIVSLDETSARWATDAAGTAPTGADDDNDGDDNLEAIQRIADWQTKFPAFAWCAAKNTGGVRGWVLPAYYELRELHAAWAANKAAFNKALTDNGGMAIEVASPADENYWSSTEKTAQSGTAVSAVSIEFYDGTDDFLLKTDSERVRAVREF